MPGPLGRELVIEALDLVAPLIETVLRSDVTNRACLVVVVTARHDLNPQPKGQGFEDGCYLVAELGAAEQMQPRFRQMALSKAQTSARTGLPTAGLPLHLLMEGDTTSWGSVVLDGLVVACCGVQSHNDEMFAMWVAAAIKARAKERISHHPPDRKFV